MRTADQGALVSRAQSGDRDAFGELVELHGGAMLAIARAYFASEADAEDAVQDAVVKVWRGLGKFAAGTNFAGWVARITVNTCLNILRARSDRLSLADFATSVQLKPRLGQTQLTPASLAGRGEEAELLKAAVGRLPEPQRVVLMLRYAEDMTYAQIATYLDVPLSTVRGRLHTAKRALNGMLNMLDSS